MEIPTFTQPRQLNRHDIKTLILSSFGGMLELYDFVIFIFFAKIIGDHFFPSTLGSFWTSINTYATFAVGFLVRPVGGMIMAHFGDLFGRKKMFLLSIVLMVFPTLVIGFLPTYTQIGYWAPILLLIARILQGFAIGAEVPAAWVFVAEHVPRNRVGLAVSMITASLSLGVLLGSAIALYINTSFSAEEIYEEAWRYPFITGGIFGIIIIFLRKYLKETPVFIEMKEKSMLSKKVPLQKILHSHLPDITFSILLTWIFTGCSIFLTLIIPNLMSDYFNVQRKDAIIMQSYTLITISVGAVLGGVMCDINEAGKTLILMLMSICFGICSWFFLQELIHMKHEGLLILYATTGLFAGGILGCIPYIIIHRFPASVRFSGISFSYNLGQAIFGGLTPVIIILMAKEYPQGILFYVLFLALLGVYLGFRMKIKKHEQKDKR